MNKFKKGISLEIYFEVLEDLFNFVRKHARGWAFGQTPTKFLFGETLNLKSKCSM